MRRKRWRFVALISGSTATALRGLVSHAHAALSCCGCCRSPVACVFVVMQGVYTPHPYTCKPALFGGRLRGLKSHLLWFVLRRMLCKMRGGAPTDVWLTMQRMTLVEATYELQKPLLEEQLRALGTFAHTHGLRRFRIDDKNHLSFEYDASRLRNTEVEHVLRHLNIAVTRKVN